MKATRFLSGRKALGSICLTLLCFVLVACAADAHATRDEAVYEGMIISYEALGLTGDHLLGTAVMMDLIDTRSISTWANFNDMRFLPFSRAGGYIELFVESGQNVSYGELLARQTFGLNVTAQLNYLGARQRLEQFEEGFAENYAAQQAALATARAEGASSLEIELLEIELELFLIRSEATRLNLENDLAFNESAIGGEEILAPADGFVAWINHRGGPQGVEFSIIMLGDDSWPYFFVSHDPAQPGLEDRLRHFDVLRYGEIYTLRTQRPRTFAELGGVGEATHVSFDVRVVSDYWYEAGREFIYVLMPVDIDYVLEMLRELDPYAHPLHTLLFLGPFEVAVDVVHALDAVVIPSSGLRTEHVHAGLVRHYVMLYEDGNIGRRYVQAGFIGPNNAQIISGLEVGARVVLLR